MPEKPPAPRGRRRGVVPPGSLVVVITYDHIDIECDSALRALEKRGVEVLRKYGNSDLEASRSGICSDAIHQGRPAVLIMDSDIKFNPDTAIALLNRPEGVCHVAYAKKGPQEYACVFPPGTGTIRFGDPTAPPVPTTYAPGGFMAIKTDLLRRMTGHPGLNLRKVNTHYGIGWWPFFRTHELETPHAGADKIHRLEPDWAFSWRVREMGEVVWCLPQYRLEHIGRYGFGAEEAREPWATRAPRWQVVEHNFG
jgi:hypothetical protein